MKRGVSAALVLFALGASVPAYGQAPPVAPAPVTAPVLLRPSDPVYPESLGPTGPSARVVLLLGIDDQGNVQSASVSTSGGPAFDAAALDAARSLQFQPATRRGAPVASRILFTYDFEPPLPSQPPPPGIPAPAPAPQPAHPTPEEVTVVALRPRRDASSVLVDVADARTQAGTQGDATRVVENVPGLARAAFASGAIIAWGSAPQDSRVFIDGVEIPALFHGAGVRSTINADLLSSIEVVPGAYGVDHGRALGGIVRLRSKDLSRSGLRGYAAVDTFDAGALVHAPLSDSVRLALGTRIGYVERLGKLVLPRDTEEFFVLPQYQDQQAKLSIALGAKRNLQVVWLRSADRAERSLPSADPAVQRSQTIEGGFQRLYADYTREGTTDRVRVTPYVGWDGRTDVARFGPLPQELDVSGARYGLRAEFTQRFLPELDLTVGADAAGAINRVRQVGTINRPPRVGDVAIFGQAPGEEINADTLNTHLLDAAPYTRLDVRLGPWTLSPGVRASALLIDTDRRTPKVGATPVVGQSRLEGAIDPRLSVRFDANAQLALTGAVGTYHQAPEPEDLSPVFGTPGLSYQSGRQGSLGASWAVTPAIQCELTGFYKSTQNLVVRSRLPTPLATRALIQDGVGRSFGAQLFVRAQPWHGWSGWLSYALSRSQRRYAGDEAWTLFDYDQPHVLTVVANKELGAWTFGARYRLASGSPRTPVFGSFYDARTDTLQPIVGVQNTDRLPRFQQLDVRVERSFELPQDTHLRVYADVQNVLFRRNAEEYLYTYDYRSRAVLSGLPTLAIVGVRVDR
jgi:TonB family protein